MWPLFQKEVSGFFSSITGYVVIIVFLVINGLLVWVFPWNLNIIDGGYSSLAPMFQLSPWILLFLIPAITMKTFSQEKKDGTLDLLFTRPVSKLQIIGAKYFSALFLVFIALMLTLPYYITVILLGDPVGNIDHGATWGSYIGLFLLASAFTSIGIFSSTLSDNIVVAFIIGIFLCAWMYAAFSFVGNLFPMGKMGNILVNMGMDSHYLSLSRGVIDSRDLIYYFGVIALFIALSNTKLSIKR
ncbi:MAG: gliding motility-associated ABC transporter permease subunit GldF [Bacteroidales bacterium]|nr:gliding motility-associated ABC transporter permease subunit GldF [Bacteroidales bacterium]MBN2819611.1 gliding motility-associated ABC transporter permease subunit GldF [Bacteroidales bacterium]